MYGEIELSTRRDTTGFGDSYRTREVIVLTADDVASALETADSNTLDRIRYALGLEDHA